VVSIFSVEGININDHGTQEEGSNDERRKITSVRERGI
jgi:hypothetical protein